MIQFNARNKPIKAECHARSRPYWPGISVMQVKRLLTLHLFSWLFTSEMQGSKSQNDGSRRNTVIVMSTEWRKLTDGGENACHILVRDNLGRKYGIITLLSSSALAPLRFVSFFN